MNRAPDIARARPWLGTIVAMRAGGLAEADALAAIERAFAEIAQIHRCMSFHEPGSDLSRLHRAGGDAVAVDPRTFDVLSRALAFARESDGLFDPGIARQLVDWALLPTPELAGVVDVDASWREIELLDDGRVRLRRPLWIDLGGIAKGYAVDRALAILRAAGCTHASVNAGGDLARFGESGERVVLDPGGEENHVMIDLRDGAVATSAGGALAHRVRGRWRGAHLDGRTRRAVGIRQSVSVVASSCCTADALTKIVLADARVAAKLLRAHDAKAWAFDARRGWRALAVS
jgi:thiamine biosynthesis lipoprotein